MGERYGSQILIHSWFFLLPVLSVFEHHAAAMLYFDIYLVPREKSLHCDEHRGVRTHAQRVYDPSCIKMATEILRWQGLIKDY